MQSTISSPLYILLAFVLYGLLHSITAALWFKALIYKSLGQWVERYYRFLYSVFSTLGILPIFALPMLLPDTALWKIPAPWVYLTGTLQLLALLALSYSVLQAGAMTFVGIPQALGMEDAQETLNINGLYRFMRHPLYTFSLIFIWLTPTMTLNWLSLYVAFTLYFIIGSIFEERKLVTQFGQAYIDYQQTTGMFFPNPFR